MSLGDDVHAVVQQAVKAQAVQTENVGNNAFEAFETVKMAIAD